MCHIVFALIVPILPRPSQGAAADTCTKDDDLMCLRIGSDAPRMTYL